MVELKEKFLNRHGLKIAVLVEIPENPKGLIFTVHGWKSSMRGSTAVAVAEVALQCGLVSVRFDCTHSCGESEGTVEKSTISTFISDLEDVMLWAKKQPWYREPYFLAGGSVGGITVMEYARKHQKEVLGLAPIATVISGQYSVEARRRRDAEGLAKWEAAGFEEQSCSPGRAVFPWSHMEDRLKYNALDYAATLKMPVFMCGGSEDDSCPPDQQQVLFEALGAADKEYTIIPGAPHSLKDQAHVAVLKERLAAWLRKHL